MAVVVQGDDPYTWSSACSPHVSILQLALHGVTPCAIDEVIWPGTFTVGAGALTLVTLVAR
jgi:hypothetical protein